MSIKSVNQGARPVGDVPGSPMRPQSLQSLTHVPASAGACIPDLAPATSTTSDVRGTYAGLAGPLAIFVCDNIVQIAGLWREFQNSARYTPFQDIDWIQSWYAAVGRHSIERFHIVLGFEGPVLRLILPLAVEQSHGVNKLRWLAHNINDYNAPVIDPDFAGCCDSALADRIWQTVADADDQIDVIDLSKQPAQIGDWQNCFIHQDALIGSSQSHLIRLERDWTTLYASLRGAKSRRRLRDKGNKLRKQGRVRFGGERRPDVKRQLIRQAITWKSAQLNGSGDRNPFEPRCSVDPQGCSDLERTLLALADTPGAMHSLRVDSLSVDGEPVAIIVALAGAQSYSMFITSQSPDNYRQSSPGTLLLVKTIELAARAGLPRYDFLAGDEPYKMDWCDEHLNLFNYTFGLTAKGKCAAVAIRNRLRVKKLLKNQPQAMAVLRGINRQRKNIRSVFSRHKS